MGSTEKKGRTPARGFGPHGQDRTLNTNKHSLATKVGVPVAMINERRLIFAIVERAVNDALGNYKIGAHDRDTIQREAEYWIFTSQSHRPWGFIWCCHHLDVCPYRVRKALKKVHGKNISSGARDYYNFFRNYYMSTDYPYHFIKCA